MPDQCLTSSGQRSAVLHQFDQRRGSLKCDYFLGLQTSSLHSGYSGLSLPSYVKEVDGKAQPSAGGGSPAIPLTTPPGHATAKPSEGWGKSSMGNGPSFKPRRGRPLKILPEVGKQSRASSSVACDRVKSNRGHRTSHLAGVEECEKFESIELQSSTPRAPYRGVRVRPRVKGFLVEIRPKRWKKTIWLGTYTSLLEAARAYDAGIFYTGKNIPFNFRESKGSFPELPRHLSVSNTDPVIMKEVKTFVKEQAYIASRRGKAQAQGPHQKFDHTGSRSMVVQGEDSVGTRSEILGNSSSLVHVKEEVIEGGQDQSEAGPFGTLDPVALQHPGVPAVEESSCWESLAPGSVQIEISEAAVNEEGDPDSASEASQTPFINPWCGEEERSTAADILLKSPTSADDFCFHGGNETLRYETAVSSQLLSWASGPFELEGNDPCALKEPARKGKDGSNSFWSNLRIPSFSIDLPEDAMLMSQSWFETSIISCQNDFEYLSDDLLSNEEADVMLWSHMEGSMVGG